MEVFDIYFNYRAQLRRSELNHLFFTIKQNWIMYLNTTSSAAGTSRWNAGAVNIYRIFNLEQILQNSWEKVLMIMFQIMNNSLLTFSDVNKACRKNPSCTDVKGRASSDSSDSSAAKTAYHILTVNFWHYKRSSVHAVSSMHIPIIALFKIDRSFMFAL